MKIRPTAHGATLRVRVSPGAAHDKILGRHGDALKVAVRAPPEKGKANRDVARLLAEAVGARPADVEVLKGATARDKTVLFRGWEAGDLEEKLERVC